MTRPSSCPATWDRPRARAMARSAPGGRTRTLRPSALEQPRHDAGRDCARSRRRRRAQPIVLVGEACRITSRVRGSLNPESRRARGTGRSRPCAASRPPGQERRHGDSAGAADVRAPPSGRETRAAELVDRGCDLFGVTPSLRGLRRRAAAGCAAAWASCGADQPAQHSAAREWRIGSVDALQRELQVGLLVAGKATG